MKDEFREFSEAALGVPFLAATTRRLGEIYLESHEHCAGQFEEPELHDVLPIWRRGKFEGELRGLAKRIGFEGVALPNSRGTAYHSRVIAKPLVMTASAVATPTTMVRRAEFRETLARSPQISLFPDDENGGTALFGLYLHGPMIDEKARPLPVLGFARLAFPDRYCRSYVGYVDLLSTYAPEMKAGYIPSEQIERASITLLEQIREEHA
jgi:hypothetical protein